MIPVVTIAPLFDKIKSIPIEHQARTTISDRLIDHQRNVEQYLIVLEDVRTEVLRYQKLQQDYGRLELQLQSAEKAVRSKIGSEQQMKLYTESLKNHIDEISMEKLELLQNSKTTIKELKRVNQELFMQIDALKMPSGKKEKLNGMALGGLKGSASVKKSDSERRMDHFGNNLSIRHIMKTQHIQHSDRHYHEGSTKMRKNKPVSGSFKINEDKDNAFNIKQNSKTFVVNEAKTNRQFLTSSNKRQHDQSQIYPFLKVSKKKEDIIKNAYLSSTKEGEVKGKKHKTKLKTNVNRSLWRDKVANRSVGSINSMEANGSQKQTL